MKKRILATTLAGIMTCLTITGCGNTDNTTAISNTGEDTVIEEGTDLKNAVTSTEYVPNFDEEPYTVHFMYTVSSKASGTEDVEAAINELTLKELNMKVELLPMTMGEKASTLSMMLAAGEPLDLFALSFSSANSFIESGYILNWADYLEYAPDIVETFGEKLDATIIDGFMIGIPIMKEQGFQPGLIVRADIMDEVGSNPDSFNITTQDYSSYDQFTELFAKVKDAYPNMTINGGVQALPSLFDGMNDPIGSNFGVLENFGMSEMTVVNWFETDQCRSLCSLSREWFEAGYYSADAAINNDTAITLMKAGNLFSFFTSIKPGTEIEKKAQTGYDVYVIPATERSLSNSSAFNGMTYALASASEDPVKAAAFYNWAVKSQEFNDLINWGVEGKDWVVNEEGLAAYPEGLDASTVSYHQDYGWAYPNQFAGHPWEGNPVDIWEQYENFNNRLERSKAFGFVFDGTSVTNQIAACTSTFDKYKNDLFWGAIDPDSGIAQINVELYQNGLQDIIDAKQEQLDAWLSSNE